MANFDHVHELHKAGQYNDAAKACLEILKEGSDIKNANLYFARSYLFMLMPADLKEHQDTFLKAIAAAARNAETPEEVFEIESMGMDFVEQWQKHCTKKILAAFCVEPTVDRWQGYINTWVKYPELSIYVTMMILAEQTVKDMAAAEGLAVGEFAKKYRPQRQKLFTDSQRHEMEFDYAERGFHNTARHFNANCGGTGDAVVAMAKKTLTSLAMLDLAFSTSLKDCEKEPDAVTIERLKGQIALRRFELEAAIGPEGKQTNIYTNNETRATKLQELRGLYAKLKALDPSFQIPELPNATAKVANQGGCYVATCVYGSYDCPQVWTLRRFRDNTLAATWYGRLFIKTYYAVSPTIVKWFGANSWFRSLWKTPLDKLVSKLSAKGVENTPYEDKNW